MLWEFLRRTGLQPMPQVLLNSLGDPACRPTFLAALRDSLAGVKDRMCGDCQRRADTNPLRVLDCKVPGDQEIIESLPKITAFLCEPCREHYGRVQQYLTARDIPFTPTPRMVRGLDYYTRTTFEFVHGSLGAQNSVLGGGRYDGLAETIGGQRSPGIGFSIGEDRLISLLGEAPAMRPDIYMVWLDPESQKRAVELARELRPMGLVIEIPPEARKMGKLMEQASKMAAHFTLIIGENERATGRYTLKNMTSGSQEELTLEEIKKKLHTWSVPDVKQPFASDST